MLRSHAEKQADSGLVLTNMEYPGPIYPLLRHPQSVTGVSFIPSTENRFLTSCEDGYVRIWRQARGPSIKILNHNPRSAEHENREFVVRGTAIDPASQLVATAGDDGKIRFWDVSSGNENGTTVDCTGRVVSIEFTSDGKSLVAGTSNGQVQVWNVGTRKPVGKAIEHGSGVSGLDVNNDEIFVGGGGVAQRWNIRTREPIGNALRHSEDTEVSVAVAIASNGKRFLTMGQDGKAKLWNNTGEIIAQLGHGNQIRGGDFSPNSDQALTASDDGTVRVWDANSGSLLVSLAHDSEVFSAAYVSASRIITCTRQGAQIWDLRFQRRVGPPCKFSNDVLFAACNSDGTIAVLADWNGFGVIWSIPQPAILDSSVMSLALQNGLAVKLDAAGGPQTLTGREWLHNDTIIRSLR